jgi:hypothetical protein
MRLADYLTDLSETHQPWELLLKSNENSFTVTEFLENLRPEDRERSVGIETGGKGDFVCDAQSGERLLQIIWSAARRGWIVRQIGDSKPHYYVTKGNLLVSLCGNAAAPADSQLIPDVPLSVSVCKRCSERSKQGTITPVEGCGPESRSIAEWLLPHITVSFGSSGEQFKRGLLVYERQLVGAKLAERNITVTVDGEPRKIPIGVLRGYYHAGKIPGNSDVLVTATRADAEVYCGEGTVATVIEAWEKAPLNAVDRQDVKRMITEFKFPDYQVDSKAQLADLKRLYDRCNRYYRYVASREEELKRLTKGATSTVVLGLDQSDPIWDATNGEARFVEEVRRQHPELIRTEAEKKAKARRWDKQQLELEERRPLIETRNNLTSFPHKDMLLEVRDIGVISIGDIKGKIRDGTMCPQTLVRYRSADEWVEVCKFLEIWVRWKATLRQLEVLRALQRQHGITDDIPLDISRKAISKRISALVARRE